MTSETPEPGPNPFVGPRPFRLGEPLFGRDREIRELRNLLVAERIVVLYSPSGAGKTSLVQAQLIPRMRESGFHVLPVIRVNQPPRDRGGNGPNRYLESALRSLELDASGTGHGAANGPRLSELLAKPPSAEDAADGPVADLLIFDQFEEILTLDPTDGAAKAEFFRQVGEALRVEGRWALFSLREEYVAALDPYLRHIPTRLAAAYRLDLLDAAAAAEAIRKPAAQAGVDFTDEAAANLIEELVEVRGHLPDGTSTAASLPFVEPVQLQVVCTRLWERLPWAELPVHNGRPRIDTGRVAELAHVDDALADYYDDRVAAIARAAAPEAPEVSERQIREWIDANLITERGARAQLRVGAERGQTLPEQVTQDLVDAYVIRREGRPGDRWFELAHDRMVQPIIASNAAWLHDHLQPAQVRARQWDETGRRLDALLRGRELRQARQWMAANQRHLPAWETALLTDFLGDSRREQRERYLRFGALVALLVLAVGLGFWYVRETEQQAAAEQQARVNLIQAFVSEALLRSAQGEHERGALLARQAFLFDEEAGAPLRDRVDDALRQTLDVAYFDPETAVVTLQGHDAAITSLAFHPDGTRLASASEDATTRLWDPADPGAAPVSLRGQRTAVNSVAFSADGQYVFSAGNDGAVARWRLADATTDAPLLLDSGHRVSANGSLLAVGDPVLDELDDARAVTLNAVDISPDGQLLAAGAELGTVLVWRFPTSDAPVGPESHGYLGGDVQSVAFSPDSRTLVAGSDRSVAVFDVAQTTAGEPAFTAIGAVRAVAVSPADRRLATAAGVDRAVQLRDLDDLDAAPRSLVGAVGNVRALAFGPEGLALATGSDDGVIRLWDLRRPERDPITLRGHVGAINAVAFSPDGRTLASGGDDATVRLWTIDTAALADAVCAEASQNLSEPVWRRIAGEVPYQLTCPDLPHGDASGAPAPAPTPAPPPESADAGSGTPVAFAPRFPDPLVLPQGQPFRIERSGPRSLGDVAVDPEKAEEARNNLRRWGWEAGVDRRYASDDPPPNAAGYVVLRVDRYAKPDGAAAALPFLAEARQDLLKHGPVDVGVFGDQTEAIAGRGYNGNEVTIFARRGEYIFQVIGVAAVGDPARDVQAALAIMLESNAEPGSALASTAGVLDVVNMTGTLVKPFAGLTAIAQPAMVATSLGVNESLSRLDGPGALWAAVGVRAWRRGRDTSPFQPAPNNSGST